MVEHCTRDLKVSTSGPGFSLDLLDMGGGRFVPPYGDKCRGTKC